MKNSQEGFIVPALLVIIAVLVIGGGVYIYKNNKSVVPAISVNTDTQSEAQNHPTLPVAQPKQVTTPTPEPSTQVSVSGMSKYTSTDLGFSFWYPSSWKVVKGQNSIDLYDQYGRDTDLGITKTTPSNGKLLLPGYACGPAEGCADLTYYFDATTHTWMAQHGTQTPIAANVSMNTMGGLHMLNGNIRFGLGTVIPLSAHNFLMVGASPGGLGGGEHNFQDYLAKTIVATDSSVATPVSAAQQIQTIQAEKDAYQASSPPKMISANSDLNNFTHYDSGITFKYPKDWKFDTTKNYFTTSDYQEGKSGARVEFIYGLSGNDWQGTVAAMYGSKSVNTPTSINGKPALRTTYPSDDHLVALSLPFANSSAFASLLLKYQAPERLSASYKDSYEPVLQSITENATLPLTVTNVWNTYVNNIYNFSFSHPPLTAVVSDGTYFKNSVASYLAMVRYGFHQLLFVFTKPTDQSLKTWYDGMFAGMSPARGPIEKTINGYSAIDVTFNDMDTPGRHVMVAKNGVVVDFLFSNNTVDSPLTSDQQKLLDSFLFLK